MLLELRIFQLGLVEDLVLPLESGLTVLTGETGAGKSMIAGALSLLTGRAVPKAMVRRGEEAGWVEGVFDLGDRPVTRGLAASLGVRVGEDGILVLRREIRREGRNRVLINGQTSSLPVLERLGGSLLGVQSQDQQRELERDDHARDVLDRALGLDDQVADYRVAWQAWRDAERRLASARDELSGLREQQDLWRYQYDELAGARLEATEEATLGEKLLLVQNAESLREAAGSAFAALTDVDGSVASLLGRAVSRLQSRGGGSLQIEAVLERLRNAEAEVDDAARGLERFLDGLDSDEDLDTLQSRKALYEELRRKYRREVPELVAYRDQLAERLRRHDAADTEIEELTADRDARASDLAAIAARLHDARTSGAAQVARRAEAILQPLALPDLDIDFEIRLVDAETSPIVVNGRQVAAGPAGIDAVALLVRTNPGEERAPAGRIASGGEKSRIHLGLTVLTLADEERPLLLFDEIDAGLGMDRAAPVAHLLRRLAEGSQVVCITHLPTVAVHGRLHWVAGKSVLQGRTRLTLRAVNGEQRVAEIARLLGGEAAAGTDEAAQATYARTLLRDAGDTGIAAHAEGKVG